jgi:hypothetical protein
MSATELCRTLPAFGLWFLMAQNVAVLVTPRGERLGTKTQSVAGEARGNDRRRLREPQLLRQGESGRSNDGGVRALEGNSGSVGDRVAQLLGIPVQQTQ